MMKGYRTYISAFGLGVVTILHALGMIPDHLYQILTGIFAAGGLAALRAAVGALQ